MDNEAPAIAMVFVDRKPAMSCLLMNCIMVIMFYSYFFKTEHKETQVLIDYPSKLSTVLSTIVI